MMTTITTTTSDNSNSNINNADDGEDEGLVCDGEFCDRDNDDDGYNENNDDGDDVGILVQVAQWGAGQSDSCL